MTIRQVQTKDTGVKGIMRSAPFVRGFTEARNGLKFDYDAFPGDINKQWAYERGRQFAYLYTGKLKSGQSVNMTAAYHFCLALGRKDIF